MLNGLRIVVVLPAYHAEKTILQTIADAPRDVVDEFVLVDDASSDRTAEIATQLGVRTFHHRENLGYGGNQKTCYLEALRANADIVVMLHPDYQYEPRLITALAAMVTSGVYDLALGSRILGNDTLRGGMPLYKYVANRFLTAIQNLLLGAKLSEYHTGYHIFRKVLETLPLRGNSDDFVFDNQMLAQAIAHNFRIGEISCPTKYFPEASSINFRRSITYGLGVLMTSVKFRLWKWGLARPRIFRNQPALRLVPDYYKEVLNSD